MTPSCKTCLHMRHDETMRERCFLPWMKFAGTPCNIARLRDSTCGPEGKYHEKRETV